MANTIAFCIFLSLWRTSESSGNRRYSQKNYIVIEDIVRDRALSTIDLYARTYTIYKPPYPEGSDTFRTKFRLDDSTIALIANKYTGLGLDSLIGKKKYEDPPDYPKFWIRLTNRDRSQELELNVAAKSYLGKDSSEAMRLRQFLKYADSIIDKLPEISSAPPVGFF